MEQIQKSERVSADTQLKENCRTCGADLISYFNLGKIPLVNRLSDTREESLNSKKYPLELLRCPECCNSQLSVVVDPKVLYANYPYRSSMSGTFIKHCNGLAHAIKNLGVKTETVLDIAGNDGTLMREIASVIAVKNPVVLDPSPEALSYVPDNVKKVCDFWNLESARKFVDIYGHANVITAQNVVAHVNDLGEFFHGIVWALDGDGIAIIEVPYVYDMLLNSSFETVYHEHLSYMSISAIKSIAEKFSMEIFRVEKHEIHCGTIRIWLKDIFNDSLEIEEMPGELQLSESEIYEDFKIQSEKRISDLQKFIQRSEGKKIIGVTASAKGTVFLNLIGDDARKIEYLIDTTPDKHGKFQPGTGLQIKEFKKENIQDAEIALILSKNIESEVTKNLIENGFRGVIYTP